MYHETFRQLVFEWAGKAWLCISKEFATLFANWIAAMNAFYANSDAGIGSLMEAVTSPHVIVARTCIVQSTGVEGHEARSKPSRALLRFLPGTPTALIRS